MSNSSELLSELADDYAERLRSGDEPTIGEYVREHPELETDIRKLFPSIRMMEQLGSREQSERKFERQTRRLTIEPDGLLGDFRIIREIGRGGMGVVYEAEQQSLKRRVALKVLGPTMSSSPRQLMRFKSEAKAAARLHHTNIVSVYGVGEDDGLHYFAMQFIDGMTLSEAIALNDTGAALVPADGALTVDGKIAASTNGASLTRTVIGPIDLEEEPSGELHFADTLTPVPPTKDTGDSADGTSNVAESDAGFDRPARRDSRWLEVARIGESVAHAMHYAHKNGVLHRDLKPSNLMIDRNRVVWVMDFGLARHEEDRDAVTASGDIVGTLRYMAPEQINGLFDARSDVYSLGLTVYEMLTLRPAFNEPHHGKLIQQKSTSAPPRPRSINSDIPRDLETVVLKACAVDPAHRYQTAEDFAADLGRFLDDRPIEARRVTAVERVWRWSRRNPSTASLSLATLGLLSILVAGFAIWLSQQRTQLKQLEDQRRTVIVQRLAQKQSANTLSRFFVNRVETDKKLEAAIASRGLPPCVAFELDQNRRISHLVMHPIDLQTEKRFLAQELAFVANNKGTGVTLGSETDAVDRYVAEALNRAGTIQHRLGLPEAAESFRKSRELYQTLSRDNYQRVDYVVMQVAMSTCLARARALNHDPNADDDLESGLEILRTEPGVMASPKASNSAIYQKSLALHEKHLMFLRRIGGGRWLAKIPAFTGSLAEEEKSRVQSRQLLGQLTHLLTKGPNAPPTDDTNVTRSDVLSALFQELIALTRYELLTGNKEAAMTAAADALSLHTDLYPDELTPAARYERAYILLLAPQALEGADSAMAIDCLAAFDKVLKQLDQHEQVTGDDAEYITAVRAKIKSRLGEFSTPSS